MSKASHSRCDMEAEKISNLSAEHDPDDNMEEDKEWKPSRLYPCGRCDELYFENKFFWRQHVFKAHGRWEREENRDVLYECRYCSKQFGLKRSRNAHHKTHKEHQRDEVVEYKCNSVGDVTTPKKYKYRLVQGSMAG